MKSSKEPNYEEFLQLVLECYEAFKEVMQKGTPMEKFFAMKGFSAFQQMVKGKVSEFSEKKGVDLKGVEQALCKSDKKFARDCQVAKEKLIQLRQEIEPFLAQTKTAGKKPASKNQRKRNMEKKLKIKG